MRFKGTIWLGVVLLAIALFYFLVDLPREERQKEEKERAETILLFDGEKVDTIFVARKEESYTLKRLGLDDWQLISPLEDKADVQTAENLLYELNNGKFSRVVEEKPQDLAAFGLTLPSLTLRVKLAGGEELALLVGDDHPMGKGLYVKTAGQSRVLLASLVREDLDKSLFDARDKSILHFNLEDIARVALRQGDHSLALKRDEAAWTLEGNDGGPADNAEIDHFLNQVRSAKVVEFISESPDSLAPYGLDAPASELRLLRKEGKSELSLFLGTVVPGEGVFAKVGGRSNVVRLPGTFEDTLSKNPADFLDKTLLAFTEDEVLGLTLKGTGPTVELAPEAGDPKRWRITQPSPQSADASTVASLLADLKEARIVEFVQLHMQSAAAFGLDQPARELTLRLTGDRTWALQIGNAAADGKSVFARREGQPQVFVLADETVKKLFRSYDDLRDKRILSFDEEAVTQVVVVTPETTFRLRKKGEDWSLEEPERIDPLKDFLVKDIFWTLKRLEYLAHVAPPPAAEATGLDTAALSLTLYKSGDERLASIAVGQPAKETPGRYAALPGKPEVYIVPERFLDEIPRTLEKYRN
ncbi:MAG: DUF4340 domain-containing protein [Nitrospinaceae bacterium]|nr:MAG: DUF4340 domain-containing protein [Nitrospinaceae bacterium]